MARLGCSASLSAVLFFAGVLSAGCQHVEEAEPLPAEQVDAPVSPTIGARRSTPSLGFMQFLDPSHEVVAYADDPVPWISRFTHSERFRRLVAEEWVVARYPDAATSSAKIDDWLGEHQASIPVAVAVGMDEHLGPTFARLLRLSLLAEACTTANQSPAARPLLPLLRAQFGKDVAATTVPSMVVWLQMVDEPAATALLTSARGLLGELPPTISSTDAPDSISLTAKFDAFVDRPGLLAVLQHLGVIEAPTDTAAVRMADAILALGVDVRLTRHHDALVLAVGPLPLAPTGTPLTRADLGDTFTPEDSSLVAWARWDLRATADVNTQSFEMLEGWKKTEAGRALLAGDSEDLAGDIADLQRRLTSSPPRGHARVEIDDELRVTLVRDAAVRATTLSSTRLLDIVPGDVAWIHLDTTSSFGDAVADAVDEGETRMYNRQLAASLREDDSAAIVDRLVVDYRRSFAGLRALLTRESRTAFVPPFAAVISTTHDSQVRLQGTLFGIGFPVPALAFVMTPAPGGDASKWLESVNREAAGAFFDVADIRPPAARAWITPKDLGLGVPTRVLVLDWIDEIAEDITVSSGPGDVLHVFEHEGFTVVSTSVALSKAILSDAKAVRATPDPGALAYTRVSSAAFADLVAAVARSVGKSTTIGGDLQLVGRLMHELGDFVMTTTADGEGKRRTMYRMEFRE